MKYKVLCGTNADELNQAIAAHIQDGWRPHGEPRVAVGGNAGYGSVVRITQAMIKE